MEAEYGEFFLSNFQCSYHPQAVLERSRNAAREAAIEAATAPEATTPAQKIEAAAKATPEAIASQQSVTAAPKMVSEESGLCSIASTESPDSHSLESSADTQATECNKTPEAVRVYRGFTEHTYRLVFPFEDKFAPDAPLLLTIVPSGVVENREKLEPKAEKGLMAFTYLQSISDKVAELPLEQHPGGDGSIKTLRDTAFVWRRVDGSNALVQTWATNINDKFRQDFEISEGVNPDPAKFSPESMTDFKEAMVRLFGPAARNCPIWCCHKRLHSTSPAVVGLAEEVLAHLQENPDLMREVSIASIDSDCLGFVADGTNSKGETFEKHFRLTPGEQCVVYRKTGWDTMGAIKPLHQFLLDAEFHVAPALASQGSRVSPPRLQESDDVCDVAPLRRNNIENQQKANRIDANKLTECGGLLGKEGRPVPLERLEKNIVVKLDQFFDNDRCWKLVETQVASEVKRSSALRASVKNLERVGKQTCCFKVQVPKPYPGVQCRRSKRVDDRHPKYAVNGAIVVGTVEDDGEWLKISSSIYLPMRVGAIQILEPLPEALKVVTEREVDRPAENANDRWLRCCCRAQSTGGEIVEAQGSPDHAGHSRAQHWKN